MKVFELFEGVDTQPRRPKSVIQFSAKVAAEELRKMGMKVRIDSRVVGRHEKTDRTVMTVISDKDVEESAILKILKKHKVDYNIVGSTMNDDKTKKRLIRIHAPIQSKRVTEGKIIDALSRIAAVWFSTKTGEDVSLDELNERRWVKEVKMLSDAQIRKGAAFNVEPATTMSRAFAAEYKNRFGDRK